MSEDNNSETKYGFKDKEKAEETIQQLESHEMQYRKLTIRGLLGRAKRVLLMTKAEEKVKNISEAIEVFEKWLAVNGSSGAQDKISKIDDNDKVDPVPGLGFKDKEAAEKTIKVLEGRDPEYIKLAVKSLITSSKRVLTGTKNEDKIKSIQEGVQILEDFLEKFDAENMMKHQKPYLDYSIIEKLPPPENALAVEFLAAYGTKRNYKHLRTMHPNSDDTSWDIIRNKRLRQFNSDELFDQLSGAPTHTHLNMIHWAYSPDPEKLKAYVEKLSRNLKTACNEEDCSTPRKKMKND